MNADAPTALLLDCTLPTRGVMLAHMSVSPAHPILHQCALQVTSCRRDQRFDITLKRWEPRFEAALKAIWQYLPHGDGMPRLDEINLVHFMTSYAIVGLKEKVLSRQTALCKELEERATAMQILFDAVVFKVIKHQEKEPAITPPPSPREIRALHRAMLEYCATFRVWKAADNVRLAEIIRGRLVHMYSMMGDAVRRCNLIRDQINKHRAVLARVSSRAEMSAFDRGNPPPPSCAPPEEPSLPPPPRPAPGPARLELE
jgi:hypothetical protein